MHFLAGLCIGGLVEFLHIILNVSVQLPFDHKVATIHKLNTWLRKQPNEVSPAKNSTGSAASSTLNYIHSVGTWGCVVFGLVNVDIHLYSLIRLWCIQSQSGTVNITVSSGDRCCGQYRKWHLAWFPDPPTVKLPYENWTNEATDPSKEPTKRRTAGTVSSRSSGQGL